MSDSEDPSPRDDQTRSVSSGASVGEQLRLAPDAGEMGTWEWRIAEGRAIWSEALEGMHGLVPGAFGATAGTAR